jgi:hypothetical protein
MLVLTMTVFSENISSYCFYYCKQHSVQCYDNNVTDLLCEVVTYHIYKNQTPQKMF